MTDLIDLRGMGNGGYSKLTFGIPGLPFEVSLQDPQRASRELTQHNKEKDERQKTSTFAEERL